MSNDTSPRPIGGRRVAPRLARHTFGFAVAAVAVLLVAGCANVPTDQEKWTVDKTIPIVALDDVQGIFITGSWLSVNGSATITYAYAYRTDHGSLRQATTDTIKDDYGAQNLPADVYEDAEPGDAHIDVESCEPVENADTGWRIPQCGESARLAIHVPPGSVHLQTTVDGPND